MNTHSEQNETITTIGAGGFVTPLTGEMSGQVVGGVLINGLTTNYNLIDTQWNLNLQTEQLEQTGGTINTTHDEMMSVGVVGGGGFTYTSTNGDMSLAGTIGLSYTQGWQGQIQAPPGSAIGGGLASTSTTSQYQTYRSNLQWQWHHHRRWPDDNLVS